MIFGELSLFNTTSDCLETACVSSWGSGLSIWIEIVLWKQGLLFFKAIQIHRQKRWNMRFGELFFCNSTSDCLETTWVSSWGSGLSIWIKIGLWKQGLLFLEPFKIKGRSGRMWDLESFYYLIQHQIVLKLLACHPGVVDCQSELKLFCGSRDLYFLKLSKITDRRGGIWDLESFYFVIQHQIVLKLLACHPGVVECKSELKLVCGSRDFYF